MLCHKVRLTFVRERKKNWQKMIRRRRHSETQQSRKRLRPDNHKEQFANSESLMLEPISENNRIILVEPNGIAYQFDANHFFTHLENSHLFRHPYTNRPLHPAEVHRFFRFRGLSLLNIPTKFYHAENANLLISQLRIVLSSLQNSYEDKCFFFAMKFIYELDFVKSLVKRDALVSKCLATTTSVIKNLLDHLHACRHLHCFRMNKRFRHGLLNEPVCFATQEGDHCPVVELGGQEEQKKMDFFLKICYQEEALRKKLKLARRVMIFFFLFLKVVKNDCSKCFDNCLLTIASLDYIWNCLCHDCIAQLVVPVFTGIEKTMVFMCRFHTGATTEADFVNAFMTSLPCFHSMVRHSHPLRN